MALEEEDAISAYGLYLDRVSMPLSARMARLGPNARDRSMSLHGERLRQVIDRKQRVIIALLRVLRLRPPRAEDESGRPQDKTGDGLKIGVPAVLLGLAQKRGILKFPHTKLRGPLESTKRPKKASRRS